MERDVKADFAVIPKTRPFKLSLVNPLFQGLDWFSQWSMVNGLLFHMTQPTSRSIIKAIACSKPIVSEHWSK